MNNLKTFEAYSKKEEEGKYDELVAKLKKELEKKFEFEEAEKKGKKVAKLCFKDVKGNRALHALKAEIEESVEKCKFDKDFYIMDSEFKDDCLYIYMCCK